MLATVELCASLYSFGAIWEEELCKALASTLNGFPQIKLVQIKEFAILAEHQPDSVILPYIMMKHVIA
jgi:hypothetical protein